jgi:uncharacterized protein YbjT (DUF2867 family)
MSSANGDGLVLVTGGTGTLGRLVVARLVAEGRRVRVLSRRAQAIGGAEVVTGELDTGEGIDAAVAGAPVIVHCAGASKGDGARAATLAAAASRAGARHLLNVSVIGADRVPVESRVDRAMFGYFAAKRAAEEAIAAADVPWTTLRATQFHDLLLTTVQGMAKLPVVPVPSGFRCQPVDAAEVADRLVELALGAPAGLAPEVAGPEVLELRDALRGYLRARGRRRVLVGFRPPGAGARAVRAGALLAPDRAVGRRTWAEFLAERVT